VLPRSLHCVVRAGRANYFGRVDGFLVEACVGGKTRWSKRGSSRRSGGARRLCGVALKTAGGVRKVRIRPCLIGHIGVWCVVVVRRAGG